ncbi:hypothetical protein QPK80_07205 [Providencia rettgeri]|nr:hypothetical protein [Providencia rettgeri]
MIEAIACMLYDPLITVNFNTSKKMITVKINKSIIITFLVILSFLSYMGKLITASDALLALCVFITMMIPLCFISEKKTFNKGYIISILLAVSVTIFFSFFSRSYDEISGILGIVYIVTPCIMCYGIYRSKHELLISRVFFYSFFLYTIPFFISVGVSNPDGYNEILSGASRNIVGAIFILLSCFHIAVNIRVKNKYPFLVPLISFICCVMLFGRSGIIISFFVLSLCSVNIFNKKYTVIVLCLVAAVISYYMIEIQEYIMTKTNFAMGAESPRSLMIKQYLSAIDLQGFVFGNDYYSCCSEVIKYGVNPHNSFIMGHARYGISHTIIVVCLLTYAMIKSRFLSVILLLVIFSRYFVDQLGLFSPMDFIILYVIFCLPRSKQNIKLTKHTQYKSL